MVRQRSAKSESAPSGRSALGRSRPRGDACSRCTSRAMRASGRWRCMRSARCRATAQLVTLRTALQDAGGGRALECRGRPGAARRSRRCRRDSADDRPRVRRAHRHARGAAGRGSGPNRGRDDQRLRAAAALKDETLRDPITALSQQDRSMKVRAGGARSAEGRCNVMADDDRRPSHSEKPVAPRGQRGRRRPALAGKTTSCRIARQGRAGAGTGDAPPLRRPCAGARIPTTRRRC